MKSGVELIADERKRQIEVKGWTAAHDDKHCRGTLAIVAAAVACDGTIASVIDPKCRVNSCFDCFGIMQKHGLHGEEPDRIHMLAVAGALIAAEIDKLQRENAPR